MERPPALPPIDERLLCAKERLRTKRRLDAVARETWRLFAELQERISKHEQQLQSEKADLDKLAGLTLRTLFHTVLGTREERLEKQRQEYLAAKLKHDEAVEALAEADLELQQLQRQLAPLREADREYAQLIEEKQRVLIESRDPRAETFLAFGERLADLDADKRELHEAIQVGETALAALKIVRDELRAAKTWGQWDMSGLRWFSTTEKHLRIDSAKRYAHVAQRALRRFQMELGDAGQRLEVAVDIGGFSSFADFFFDGLIADWVVQSKIQNALSACTDPIAKVEAALAECHRHLAAVKRDAEAVAEQHRQFIEQA